MIFFHTGILPLLQPFDFDKWSLQFWVFTLNPESKCPISVFIPFYSKGDNLQNLIQFQGDKIQFQNSSLYLHFLCAAFMFGSKYTFPSIRIINNGFRNQIQIFCGSIQKNRDASVNRFFPLILFYSAFIKEQC